MLLSENTSPNNSHLNKSAYTHQKGVYKMPTSITLKSPLNSSFIIVDNNMKVGDIHIQEVNDLRSTRVCVTVSRLVTEDN